MKYISKAPITRLVRDCGGQRIGDDLVEEISVQAEAVATQLANKAVLVARLQESKTVKRKHLMLALEMEN